MSQASSPLSDAAFRLIVESSEDITAVRGADGYIRYASPSVQRVLGYKQQEVVGSTCFDLIHPEDRANVLAALNEFEKTPGARDSIHWRARHADGSWVSLEVVAYNMLDDPAVRGVVINGRDIGARKLAETAQAPPIPELPEAPANTLTLPALLHICASCKKIRDEAGKWKDIEVYVREHVPVEFSHGMCQECVKHWYPDHYGK